MTSTFAIPPPLPLTLRNLFELGERKKAAGAEQQSYVYLCDLLMSSISGKKGKKDESGAIFSRIIITTHSSSILYRIALMFA
jgi:hypothetical protein